MGKTIIEVFTDSVNPFCFGLYGCYNCIYCHTVRLMKAFPKNFQPGVYLNRLDEYLNAENKSIFLNSMFDICHPKISDENLTRFFKIIQQIDKSNTLTILTKNPKRLIPFADKKLIPRNCYVGATVETDTYSFQNRQITLAPDPEDRLVGLAKIKHKKKLIFREPAIKSTSRFVDSLRKIPNLKIIVFGMNSRIDVKLVEPSREELEASINDLKEDFTVYVKENTQRLGIVPDYRIIRHKNDIPKTLFDFNLGG